jgi:RNA polymerase sigma-70 factor (ECF subfamily)
MEPSLRSRVRDGDPDAFGVLFDDFARSVHHLAFRLTGSRQEAEEIVSLTFLEAWRLRGGIEPEGESLRPWLMGITVNVVRNFSRASRRQRAAMTRLPAPEAVPDFADELAGRIDDAARLAAVRAAFGRLRPAEQDVVALCVWVGPGLRRRRPGALHPRRNGPVAPVAGPAEAAAAGRGTRRRRRTAIR